MLIVRTHEIGLGIAYRSGVYVCVNKCTSILLSLAKLSGCPLSEAHCALIDWMSILLDVLRNKSV